MPKIDMVKNPNFKRIERINTNEQRQAQIEADKKRAEEIGTQTRRESKQEAKYQRWQERGTIGQRTEQYIRLGYTESEAFNTAILEC